MQTLLTSIIGMLELERAGLASIKENDGEMEKRMKEKKERHYYYKEPRINLWT